MEKLYKIEKPDIGGFDISESLKSASAGKISVSDIIDYARRTEVPEYLSWKDLKYKTWIPEHYRHKKEEFWALMKCFRKMGTQESVIRDTSKQSFTWKKFLHFEQMLHEIDMDMTRYLLNFPELSDADRKLYQMDGIIEEAIASSQLEGAHTTRKVAKQMIQEKRRPATHAERMIHNNYLTMKAVQQTYKDHEMSMEMLLDLHRMLSNDTMEQDEQGKLRSPSDQIVIQKGNDPAIISYIAPPIKFVEKEIKRFIDFANDRLENDKFVHPVIKAIMLHFWMGFLHPFVDGNGRLARCVFYWYLLRKGYWAFAFLPISIAIKKAPAKYSEAYVLSEQDDNDLNYFIDYHIKRIQVAIESFREYVKGKVNENKKIDKLLAEHHEFNRRQITILSEFQKHPDKLVTVTTYLRQFEISKMTAIKDLSVLHKAGYLQRRKQGRSIFYFPKEDK